MILSEHADIEHCYIPKYLLISTMSGRISPAGDAEGGLPEGVYINPDNLPPVNTSHIENDYDDHYDVAPARGTIGKTAKLKGIFKKPGKKHKDPPGPPRGVSQLGDVLGKTGGSSAGSRDDISRGSGSRHDGSREDIPPSMHQPTDSDKSKMATFKDFFKKHDTSHPAPHSTSAYGQQHHTSKTSHSATMDSMRTTVMNFFSGPSHPIAPPVSTADAEIAQLKPAPRRSPCRMSIFMFVMFGLMVFIGIILLIMGFTRNSLAAERCMVIGPIFIGLGCFLIIGEIFFMMFWMEDPMPCLGDCVEKMNAAIGGVEDPYGLKNPETYKKPSASYYPGLNLSAYIGVPPASPSAKETIPMKTMYSGGGDYSSGPSGPAAFDDPAGPAALDYNPLPR